MAHHMTNTPLMCGHAFRAEVRPRSGERVWCHDCSDYRYVRPQHRATADPVPAPQLPTCLRGHERTPENTYQRPSGGDLVCRICRRLRPRRRRISP